MGQYPTSPTCRRCGCTEYTVSRIWANKKGRMCANCGAFMGFWFGCFHCGNRNGNTQQHYIQSPQCWDAEQTSLAARSRWEKEQGRCHSIYRHYCRGCRRKMFSRLGNKRWCPYCLKDRIAEPQRARRAKLKQDKACEHCDLVFSPARSDAKFCCAACRQAEHRNRVTGIELSRRRQNSVAVTSIPAK